MSSELDDLLSVAKPTTAIPETIGALSTSYARQHGRQRRLRRWLAASTAGIGLGVLGVSAAAASSSHYDQPQWVADIKRPAVLPNGQACTIEFWFIPQADQIRQDKNLVLGTDAVQRAERVLENIDFTSPEVVAAITGTDRYRSDYRQGVGAAASLQVQKDVVAAAQAAAAAAAAANGIQQDVAPAGPAAIGSELFAIQNAYSYGALDYAQQHIAAAGVDTSRVDLLNGGQLAIDCGSHNDMTWMVGQ